MEIIAELIYPKEVLIKEMVEGWITKKELIQQMKQNWKQSDVSKVDDYIAELKREGKLEHNEKAEMFRIDNSYFNSIANELSRSKVDITWTACKRCGKTPRANYGNWCMECSDELGLSGAFEKKERLKKELKNMLIKNNGSFTSKEISSKTKISEKVVVDVANDLKESGVVTGNEEEGYTLTEEYRKKLDEEKPKEIDIPFTNKEIAKLKSKGLVNDKEFTDKGNQFVKEAINKEYVNFAGQRLVNNRGITIEELVEAKGNSREETEQMINDLVDVGAVKQLDTGRYVVSDSMQQKLLSKGHIEKNVINKLEEASLLTNPDDVVNKDVYFPTIRHGYLNLKFNLEKKRELKFPEEVQKILWKEHGYNPDGADGGNILEDAEMFEIDPKTIMILQLTDNEIFERQTPFPKFVIDCDVNIDGFWFKGFYVTTKGHVLTFWGNRDGYCDNFLLFETFNPNLTGLEKYFVTNELNKKILKKVKIFICNFIDFLNNPEVRIAKMERSVKNMQRRLKKGKEVLPSAHKIIISSELKSYFDKMHEPSERASFSHRFIVRGHFKRFWNKKRFRILYEQLAQHTLDTKRYYVDSQIKQGEDVIMIWNKPFIKGKGVLVSHKYELKKE